MEQKAKEAASHAAIPVSISAMLVTLGVVYGDIGTSPMYVTKALVAGNGGIGSVTEEFVLGALSLVVWTVTLLTTIKYVLISLRADNHGEGGIFALYSLVKRCGKWLIIPAMLGGAALLADGIGDTIRVSLTEAPENEIPVAQLLVEHFADRPGEFEVLHPERYTPTEYRRRSKVTVPVVHTEPLEGFRVLEALSGNPTAELRAAILNLDIPDEPVVVKRRYEERSLETLAVKAAADLGPLLLDGLADGIWIDAPGFAESEIRDIELMILQAARVRFSHTEYIACPSCGRTLYDIEGTLAQIKARTSHLKNLKIGVMGCIVNGPGEMADADYGYVGAGRGQISLYKGKECVLKNIPEEDAVERLVQLIKENGDWVN